MFTLILMSVSLFIKAQETGYPIIRNYPPKEYNNSPQIRCSIQDDRGILYFGSGDLIEYDGVSWSNVLSRNILRVYDFAKDKNGRIYVAALDEFGYLAFDKKGNTVFQSLKPLLKDSTLKLGIVRSVKLNSEFVYFQSLDVVLQYSTTTNQLLTFKAETDENYSGSFIFADSYYVISSKSGLLRIENGQIRPQVQSGFYKDKNSLVNLGMQYDDSTLLIPTNQGDLFLAQPNKDVLPKKLNTLSVDFIKDNKLNSATKLTNTNFILGSLRKGAILTDHEGNTLQQYNKSKHLQNNNVTGVYSDSQQNIWLSLNNGLSKAEPGFDLSYWDRSTGLDNNVTDIIRHNGTIYISTYSKVFLIDKNNKIKEINGIPNGVCWSFFEPKQVNSLLVGTQFGIYEIKGESATQVFSGSHATFFSQSLRNPERILSSNDELLISFRYEKGKWIFEGQWSGIKDDLRAAVEDEDGNVWITTFIHGILKVSPDYQYITKPLKIRYYTTSDGLSSLSPIAHCFLKNKIIWCTTKGFYQYNKGKDRFEPFSEFGEQYCNGSRDIIYAHEMADGKIWMCSLNHPASNIGYLQPNNHNGYDWIYSPFHRIPGLSIDAVYVEQSGIAWIGGNEGVYRYDNRIDTKDYTKKFKCLIRKITLENDSTLEIGTAHLGQQVLNYQYNSMKFEYAAPFFDQEDKTLYSFKLEGFDKEWSKWSRQTQKEYTNLPEGIYTFKVKAKNVYHLESEMATFTYEILPPFYRAWWAYATDGLLLVLFIWGIVKLNSIRSKKEKVHLEKIIQQRTSEITKQKEELHVQKDRLEIANATKDKFFSIVAHDLRNPFNAILGFSDLIIEQIKDKDYEGSNESAEYVHQSAYSAYELLENLLTWSRSQTGSILFKPEKLELKALVDKNMTLLKNSADIKGIMLLSTITTDCIVYADKEMVLTILRNLITNAIKFSNVDDRITIEAEDSGERITIHVTDTGIGINDKIIGKLFKVDESVKSTGTAKETGTGLGLILCKEFVAHHKGEIRVESKEGVGSRFSFTLPKFDEASQSRQVK